VSESTSPRIIFAGTPEFAVPSLNRLVEAELAPLAVLTQPDRPSGRGRRVQPGPVKQAAVSAGLSVHQPASLNDQEVAEWLTGQSPDVLIVVAYGQILPRDILQIPRFGCWNIHASLLPRWRGAAPIQRAIEAGDDLTGVCIMQMDEGLDTGPVLASRSTRIAADETGGSLHDRLALLGAEVLVHCVQNLRTGQPMSAVAQPSSGITYAAKLSKAEAELDWNLDAIVLERKVRAFNPWPVAWCELCGERTRIWSAQAIASAAGHPPGGIVGATGSGIDIATGKGSLRLLSLQRPGGRPLGAAEFLNARPMVAAAIKQA